MPAPGVSVSFSLFLPLFVVVALLLGARTVAAQTTIWSATLNVEVFRFNNEDGFGCMFNVQESKCSDLLTDNTFTHEGTNYKVLRVESFLNSTRDPRWFLILHIDKETPRNWTFHVDDRVFPFKGVEPIGANWVWFPAFPSKPWNEGDMVSLSLTVPATTTRTPPSQPPSSPQSPPPPPPLPDPDIESDPEEVLSGEYEEGGFFLIPVAGGENTSYGGRPINVSVNRDRSLPSDSNPAIIVSGDILERVERITFDLLSEVSLQQPPPPGLRLEGFAAEVDLVGVELSEEESVTVCLPPAEDEEESDIYRYNEVSEEWELSGSRPKRVNGEDLVCAETDAFSLTGVFVEEEETDGGGCAIAAGNGEAGTGWSENTVFNLLLSISVLLLIPGKSLFRH